MAELNPGALFPRGENYIPPTFQAPAQLNMMREAEAQAAMQSRLAQIEEERQRMLLEQQRLDQPLFNTQRQVKMGAAGGELARQPDVLAREAALASGARQRAPIDVQVMDVEAQGKLRAEKMKKSADEMETFIQAFEPVIKSSATADYAGNNAAWEQAFKVLEDAGHDTSKWRTQPRDQLLQRIKQQYTHAINNAPTIRERIKADEAHARELKKIEAQGIANQKVAAARAAAMADKPAGKQEALAVKLLEGYGKGKELTEAQTSIVTEYLDNTPNPAEREVIESFWNDKEREAYLAQRRARLRRQYPKLYGQARAAPQTGDLPPGVPAGSKVIGQTPDKKPVYLAPDGKNYVPNIK